ncbi:TPA_asm: Alt [African termite bidnaparvovirus]|nr:TPA_asm: Alt [African termite bidnaparvovirus]
MRKRSTNISVNAFLSGRQLGLTYTPKYSLSSTISHRLYTDLYSADFTTTLARPTGMPSIILPLEPMMIGMAKILSDQGLERLESQDGGSTYIDHKNGKRNKKTHKEGNWRSLVMSFGTGGNLVTLERIIEGSERIPFTGACLENSFQCLEEGSQRLLVGKLQNGLNLIFPDTTANGMLTFLVRASTSKKPVNTFQSAFLVNEVISSCQTMSDNLHCQCEMLRTLCATKRQTSGNIFLTMLNLGLPNQTGKKIVLYLNTAENAYGLMTPRLAAYEEWLQEAKSYSCRKCRTTIDTIWLSTQILKQSPQKANHIFLQGLLQLLSENQTLLMKTIQIKTLRHAGYLVISSQHGQWLEIMSLDHFLIGWMIYSRFMTNAPKLRKFIQDLTAHSAENHWEMGRILAMMTGGQAQQ